MNNSVRFLAVADQIKRERVAAKPIVAQLRSSIGDMWDRDVPLQWRTAGFVQELTETAADVQKVEPRKALAISQYAIVIATSIAGGVYPDPIPAVIEAEAWKQLGDAHRYLSEFDAALRALAAAEKRLDGAAAADWERAIVRFSRAYVLCDMHRLDEASVLAEETAAVFEQYKELRRAGQALLLKGTIEHRSMKFDDSSATFAHAIDLLKQTDNLSGLASAYNNFGYSQAERGVFPSAVSALQKALSIFEELNFSGEAARSRCILATVLLRTQRYHQAGQLFLVSRRSFRELGMVEEAGIAGLDLADSMLAAGNPAEARAVVEEVVLEFRTASLNERAIFALAYLRDIVDTPRGREAVNVVRQYLEDLRQSPLQVFVPLPE